MRWACHHGVEHKKVVTYQCGHEFLLCEEDYRTYKTCPFNKAAHEQTYNAGREYSAPEQESQLLKIFVHCILSSKVLYYVHNFRF